MMQTSRSGLCHIEGFLQKKSPKGIMGMHRWQMRYFMLYEDRLDYYKSKGDPAPIGSIGAQLILEVKILPLKRNGARFDVTIDGETERIFSLLADTQETCMRWVKELNAVLAVVARKPKLATQAVLIGGKTPWKNSAVIQQSSRSKLETKRYNGDVGEQIQKARHLGFACGQHLRDFEESYGSMYKITHRSRSQGMILHIVPKENKEFSVVHKYFQRTVEDDIPFLMKAEVYGLTRDAIWIVYDHGISSLYSSLKARKRLSERKVRKVAAEVCLALRCLHESGQTFPMLRPENIFFSLKGQVRLVDCWQNSTLSRKAYGIEDIVSEYVTPDYLLEKKDDALSDWYRLGVLIYELICGIPPFFSLTHDRTELLGKIRNCSELLETLQFPPDCSDAAKDFVLSLLGSRDGRERFLEPGGFESEAFFAGTDFGQLMRAEEAEQLSRRMEREKYCTAKYDLAVELAEARDLRLGPYGQDRFITCGLVVEKEGGGSYVTAPHKYTSTNLSFHERNKFTLASISENTDFTLSCHAGGGDSSIARKAKTHLKFSEIFQGKELDRGMRIEKWVDLFGSDSTQMGDILVAMTVEQVLSTRKFKESDLDASEFFEISGSCRSSLDTETGSFRRESSTRSSSAVFSLSLLPAGSQSALRGANREPNPKSVGMAKSAVSKKQHRRLQEDSFDLDLTYITKRLVAMAMPSEVTSKNRNPMAELQRFLNTRHKDHFKVYNLCIEAEYAPTKFENYGAYPFERYNCPEMHTILDFCLDVDTYLTADERNCAFVHCKSGKGRAGMMIASYMVFAEICPCAETAVKHYYEQRLNENDENFAGFPSQLRYVKYFERYLRECHWATPPKFMDLHGFPKVLHHVRLSMPRSRGEKVTFRVTDVNNCVLYEHVKSKAPVAFDCKLKCIGHSCSVPLSGDRKIAFYQGKKFKELLCWLWIQTGFIENNYMCFRRDEIDGLPPSYQKFPKDFTIELFFVSEEEIKLRRS